MNTFHDALVQDRIDALRREAEEERLVRQLRRARRANAREARRAARGGAPASGTASGRRSPHWGTAA
ncbi:hypothetical protein [Streptomyces sp. B6B3]|uniref:hypothetical protein n=1 Tax=Streptomyces sp. B6B3 TaxID=3153570 RepID=UPI00325EFAD3